MDKVRRRALWAVALANALAAWFPFTPDLPKRLVNTASQAPDGAWVVDARSRVTAIDPGPVAVETTQQPRFELTVGAAAAAPLSGPARIFSIGQDPYQPSLMVGIDGSQLVVRLPCGDSPASPRGSAEWQASLSADERLLEVVQFQPGRSDGVEPVSLRQRGERLRLTRSCPAGTTTVAPDPSAPWTMGNVASGHRPFIGRVSELVLEDGARRVDLLRQLPWQTPAVYWRWPERWLQRADDDALAAAAWHFASFVPLGYLRGALTRSATLLPTLAPAAGLTALINGGKLFIAGRHASVFDMVVNIAGAAAGWFLWLRGPALSRTFNFNK